MSSNLVQFSEETCLQLFENAFDVLDELGSGNFGTVYKAVHKANGLILAIKQLPILTDLNSMVKEVSVMQQCESPYLVHYYGAYTKQDDLCICMEYCDAGSVNDVMKLRKKTLSEDEVAVILSDTLNGLEYLHSRRIIHRDIKAANILLNTQCSAKLADFGVAGQLSDTTIKRKTVSGTLFWMAPEMITQVGHDCAVDIWSLGITAIQMVEGRPPYSKMHPMRALFLIPKNPPPSFREPNRWSTDIVDFVNACLVKNPEERANAADLLNHAFIRNTKPRTLLKHMIEKACAIRQKHAADIQAGLVTRQDDVLQEDTEELLGDAATGLLNDQSTLKHDAGADVVKTNKFEDANSVECGTLIPCPGSHKGELLQKYNEDCVTLVPGGKGPSRHFSKSAAQLEHKNTYAGDDVRTLAESVAEPVQPMVATAEEQNMKGPQPSHNLNNVYCENLDGHFKRISDLLAEVQQQMVAEQQMLTEKYLFDLQSQRNLLLNQQQSNELQSANYQQNHLNPQLESLQSLTLDELNQRLNNLDFEMKQEIAELKKKYNDKRQNIQDAINEKKNHQ